MSKIDWIKLKNEYINTNISYRKLAEKYDVSANTLTRRAIKEKWAIERANQYSKVTAKVQQKTAEIKINQEVDRIANIMLLSDKLSDKIKAAAEQLEKQATIKKTKTKAVKTNNGVCDETIEETETRQSIECPIDARALKQLTSALKDINDICDGAQRTDENLRLVFENDYGDN